MKEVKNADKLQTRKIMALTRSLNNLGYYK